MLKREPTKREIILVLITRRPWLTPFIAEIHSLGGTSIGELRELLGVRTPIIKRALWWLQKYGVVEKSGEKYVISQEYRPVVDELKLQLCKQGRVYVLKLGATYFVIAMRRTKITSYTVPEKLIEKLDELTTNAGGAEFTPKDLVDTLSIPYKLASRVVKTYKLLRACTST